MKIGIITEGHDLKSSGVMGKFSTFFNIIIPSELIKLLRRAFFVGVKFVGICRTVAQSYKVVEVS